MTKRMVLALDNEDGTVAIGPVGTDEAVEELRDMVEELGWTNYGVVPVQSATDFRRTARAQIKAA